jgi:hypothetical protein
MTGQVIGTVNVQVGGATRPRVTAIQYGGANQLKQATDLSMAGAQDGDVVVYNQQTNSFVVQPVAAELPRLDGGTF